MHTKEYLVVEDFNYNNKCYKRGQAIQLTENEYLKIISLGYVLLPSPMDSFYKYADEELIDES